MVQPRYSCSSSTTCATWWFSTMRESRIWSSARLRTCSGGHSQSLAFEWRVAPLWLARVDGWLWAGLCCIWPWANILASAVGTVALALHLHASSVNTTSKGAAAGSLASSRVRARRRPPPASGQRARLCRTPAAATPGRWPTPAAWRGPQTRGPSPAHQAISLCGRQQQQAGGGERRLKSCDRAGGPTDSCRP